MKIFIVKEHYRYSGSMGIIAAEDEVEWECSHAKTPVADPPIQEKEGKSFFVEFEPKTGF